MEYEVMWGASSSKETPRVVEARVNLDTTTFQQKEVTVTASGPSLTEGTMNIILAENSELNNKKTDQSANCCKNQNKPCSDEAGKLVAAAIYNQQEIKEELIIPDILEENSSSQAKAYDKEVEKRIQDFLSDRIWADHDNPAEDPLSILDTRNVEGPGESGSEGVMADGNRSKVNSSKESALSVDTIDGKTTKANTSKELTTRFSTITVVDIDQRMIDPAKQLQTKDHSSSMESFESVQTRQSKRIQDMKSKLSTSEDFEHVRMVSRNKDLKSREDLDNLRQAIRKQDLKSMGIISKEAPINVLPQSRNQDLLLRKRGPGTKEFVMSKHRMINNRLVIRQQESNIADFFNRQVTKYRRILPSTKEANNTNVVEIPETNQDQEDAEGKDDVNQKGSSNQAINQTGVKNQTVPQQIPTGQYISFGTPMQPSSSIQNVSIPMQQQFSMSSPQGQTNLNQSLKSVSMQRPSTAQGNQLHLIQPQFAFSTPQIRATSVTNHGGNIQPLTRIVQPQQPINSQNLVINQSAPPFAVSQPVFVTSGMVADTTSQFVPSSVLSTSGTSNPVFYLKTDQGLVRMP
ncbi:hypothetical protein J6590_014676 [Homalodisca vitripennis]|nr:hypothetical protein J6590_014676 [Homalodisca vitripennis]